MKTIISSIDARSIHPSGRGLVSCLLLALLVPPALAQQEQDFLFGTWVLQPGLSIYLDEEGPKSQTRVYKPHEQGVETVITTVDANGIETISSYIADYDGVPHPVYGLTNTDSIALERVNPYTAIATFMHAGNPTGTAERTISETGNQMTVTIEIGDQVISKAVYEKLLPE